MDWKKEWKWAALIVLACGAVFANSLGGEFVYDDTRQIVRNPLIQSNERVWKALASDVWAFKGDGTVAASNYWRPTFTAWHIINFRLFGAEPFGWHLLNLLLHSGVCVLGYALLRRWAFSALAAAAVMLIFAVHPVHVESVAWISGSPDLLFSLSFLGSLWFFQIYADKRSANYLVLSVILYAVALGAKEIGIVCLPIYYFILNQAHADEAAETTTEGKKKKKSKKAVDNKTPLLFLGGVAAVYFLMRWSVLGAVSRPPEDAVGLVEAVMSVPAIFAFYLRQLFFPYWISINYPLTPVSDIGLFNFLIPLALSLAVLGAMFYFCRSNRRLLIAAGLFLLPLIPAMNATAFIPDQMVHDRYLYLPLLGVLMLLAVLAGRFINDRYVLAAAVAIAGLVGFQSFLSNRAWANELSLWTAAREIDDSAFSSNQYGSALAEAERYDTALEAYSEGIKKYPSARGHMGRARVFLKMKRLDEAERDLKTVLALPPEKVEIYALYQTYEALGVVYSEQKNYGAAAAIYREAREKLPIYSASVTVKLAIILYQSGQKDEALRELEAAQTQARRELLPEAKSVFLRLGMLYAEQNRREEARSELQEYLRLTSTFTDKVTSSERNQAAALLERLK